ncbi:DUF4255 domain-containing protein [Salmonella enterica subsp. salamae]|uniref:DUF4255 domain-containing protein n=1 Tax=Salmonella enterica subsp. salamae TaxID=59202 RepID=A0A5Y2S7I8_SALER|nr:DUF4255 domain-containing protein [Salmonella enterica subsp. salamae]ECF6054074.1 DUF4255 domain-containing protein [Salmonella enterica subsp. salamae]ECG1232755.1 DUF4255 domain-containing protein [Salmonella enterica subsp. salamae]ECI3324284.1 DUF4255 domain-containing protein [Salmonella enterica subsp. salamae]
MSDYQTLPHVNNAINNMLRTCVSKDVAIRFDLPDVNATQSDAAISVFLYDIHEDLQLRTAESRGFNAGSGRLSPGWANVKCSYLITYWESTGPATDAGNPDSQPDNQAIKVMSQVLAALINNRQLADIPGAYTQVIPPTENLNSLGNFWQALGNRPRLSLNYCVTVPISLRDKGEDVTPVKSLSATVEPKAPVSPQAISDALREQLIAALGGSYDARLAMTHVNLDASPVATEDGSAAEIRVTLRVSGITRTEYLAPMDTVFVEWKKNDAAAFKSDGYRIYITAIDKTDLTGI